MAQFRGDQHRVFRNVALSGLIKKEVQLVPEGVWIELKPQVSLKLSIYKPGNLPNDLQLCSEHQLEGGQSFLLSPAQFFQLSPKAGGKAGGHAEFSAMPDLYFNKKFNHSNGLGQPHSEVSYFKAYYVSWHPGFGLRPLQVLDLGCGRGRNGIIFAGDCEQDYTVLGLDHNAESLAVWHSMAHAETLGAKFEGRLVNLDTWRAAPVHDIAMAIVSLQFLQKAVELLCHCMEKAAPGALHLAVFPIASSHPAIVWPGSFHFLPQSDEVKYLYMTQGWSILEYRESYGHLGKAGGDNLPLRGLFATLIAQKI